METRRVDNEALFELLDHPLNAWETGRFPWETSAGHDHAAAEDDVREIYSSLRIGFPRIAWASSPAAMWGAVQILKGYAHKGEFIDSLVPRSAGIEAEAKRSVLQAILDTDVLTSTGACLKGLIRWNPSCSLPPSYRAIEDIADLIGRQEETGYGRKAVAGNSFVSRNARFHMNVVYPALYDGPSRGIVRHAFSMLAYARVCWLCMPPEYVKTDAEGYLHSSEGPAARWSDGFEIFRDREAEERSRLEAARTKQLTDGGTE